MINEFNFHTSLFIFYTKVLFSAFHDRISVYITNKKKDLENLGKNF